MTHQPGECPYCGGSMKHVGETSDIGGNGHHNQVYYCPDCDRRRVSG